MNARAQGLRFLGPAVILLGSLVAISPQLILGPSCGGDFNFHFYSWVDAQHSWRQGIFYPRWAPSPDYHAGEPRFIFYPPLEWMAGAALGMVLPWNGVPIALTFMILAGIGLATRALALDAMEDAPATLAGCAAMFFGYALFTAYERADFAELTGGIWVPLLILFILRGRNLAAPALNRALDGSAALLALPLAMAWFSNAPLGVMASYLLAAIALAVTLMARSWAPVIRAGVAAALGLGLAAVYVVPAAWEQRWVAINRATGELSSMIQGSWLFARHGNPDLLLHDQVLHQVSMIVVAMVAITLAGVLVSWRRGRLPGGRKWWLPLATIPFVVLYLQLPISFPVWRSLPELHFMQFPWRWLVVLESPMGIFFAAAVWPARMRWRFAVLLFCAALFALETIWAGRFWFQPCGSEDTVPALLTRIRNGAVFNGSDEYAPPHSNDDLLALGLPDACLENDPSVALGKENDDGTLEWNASQKSCLATYPADRNGGSSAEHLIFHAKIIRPGFLVLRLRTYPAWRVRVNGKPAADLPERDDGLMAVPVPEGPVDLTVDWTTTPDVIAGRFLSCLSLIALAGLYLVERRRKAHSSAT